jgi:hypothetical protein
MTQIQPGVRDRIQNPGDGQVTLLVEIAEAKKTSIEELEGAGAEVEEVLPYDIVALSIAENDLTALSSLEIVESIEIEGEGHQMEGDDTGNPKSPAGLIP